MQSQTRTNQGGSVVSFVVVGLVLVAVAIGAIYLVQERSQHTQPTPSPTASTTKSPQPTNKDESKDGESKKRQPQSSPQPSRTPSAMRGQENLPKTGPEEALLSIVASASLVGMTVAYVRSLRYRLHGASERSVNSRTGSL